MFDIHKIAATREKNIRRIIGSMFLMVFGIYMVCLFNKIIGVISIAISSIILVLHLYFLLSEKNRLASLEIKITTEKVLCEDKINNKVY